MMAMTMHGTRMRGLSIQLLTEGRHRGAGALVPEACQFAGRVGKRLLWD